MLIVIAEEKELELVKEAHYFDPPILITGPGIANVMKALKDIPRDTYIINIGYAGGHKLEVGKWYDVSQSNFYHEVADIHEIGTYLQDKGEVCFTSTDFVTKTNKSYPCLFDMELAAICNMGFKKVRSMKKVSDSLNYEEFKQKSKQKK